MLESAKTSYEAAMDTMAKDVEDKQNIIRLHFVDAAQKAAQQRGKLGASFFKPSVSDVQAQMQLMVESSLTRNMELETELGLMAAECDALRAHVQHLEACVAAAVNDGFDCVPYEQDGYGGQTEEVDHFS